MAEKSHAPHPSLLDSLRAAPDVLEELIETIPEERLDLQRRPHFWTIRRHVLHLSEVQPMLYRRIERFRDEKTPNFTPYLPEGEQPTQSPPPVESSVPAAIEELRRWRERQLELITGLPETVWKKRAVHPEFELYTASILVRHISMHDYWHMYRIEELWITKDDYLTELE